MQGGARLDGDVCRHGDPVDGFLRFDSLLCTDERTEVQRSQWLYE